MTTGGHLDHYRRGDMAFDVLEIGPIDGIPVVFLHGFPQFNTSWAPVMERLSAEGYRRVAPNQRGYSPGARPPRRRDYLTEELAADVVALIDAIGTPRVHLVGHDWGATVAFFKALATSSTRARAENTWPGSSVSTPANLLRPPAVTSLGSLRVAHCEHL
jgi:pimeloyl-ACP methyl ester carboxylesterase